MIVSSVLVAVVISLNQRLFVLATPFIIQSVYLLANLLKNNNFINATRVKAPSRTSVYAMVASIITLIVSNVVNVTRCLIIVNHSMKSKMSHIVKVVLITPTQVQAAIMVLLHHDLHLHIACVEVQAHLFCQAIAILTTILQVY